MRNKMEKEEGEEEYEEEEEGKETGLRLAMWGDNERRREEISRWKRRKVDCVGGEK